MIHLHRANGDTLVEVVIALAILAVMLASAYNVANYSYNVGAQARESTEAAQLIQDQAEELRLYRDGQVAADPSGTGDIFSAFGDPAAPTPFYMGTNGVLHTGSGTGIGICYNLPTCSVTDYVTETTNTNNLLNELSINIQVSWTSILSNTPQTSQINYYLTDTRPIAPCDNSIAGTCQ
jgi:Tfp pilus assembly protein PilV